MSSMKSPSSVKMPPKSPVTLKPLQTVPSLVIDLPMTAKSMTQEEFARSVPVHRRGRFDLFGLNGKLLLIVLYITLPFCFFVYSCFLLLIGDTDSLSLSDFSNNVSSSKKWVRSSSPGQKETLEAMSAKRLQYIRRLSDLRAEQKETEMDFSLKIKTKGKGRDNYNINKLLGGNDPFMKSENERKENLDKAVQKKKDKKDDLFHKRRASVAVNAKTALHDLEEEKKLDEKELASKPAEAGENEMEGQTEKYFGEKARVSFAKRFKDAAKDFEKYPYDSMLPEEKRTPRSMYLREVSKQKLLPLPIILRKESNPMGVHLPHRGIGDVRMGPMIAVMDNLPGIQTVDLRDNRLTDITLIPLAAKLLQFKSLTYLDLSFNKIDKSSATIMDFLKSEDCKLLTLMLNGADVDDGECKNIADALSFNKSIRTLCLSKNLIGNEELLNVLNPSMVTGGEAIGDMLRLNDTITELDLSWNGIRLDSAIAIAEALEVNNSLKTLLLGYNSFGDMPSQILGRTLKVNTGLTLLDIEYNSITPKAATVMANAISFNETLLKLNINGNVLGKIGAQALVGAIQRSSRENRALQVSFINCDCVLDEGNIFSAANPHGTWRLNLKEPYGQMVAAECMYLANFKAGCRIVKLWVNQQLVTLERSYIVSSEEGEAGVLKKFKLEEFYKNSRIAATELLAENMPEASKALNNLLTQFDFKMEEEMRLIVLQKTLELWTAKAKREGRDVRFRCLLSNYTFFLK
jgi:hypothetical protein